jgi:chromosome segregation ATPase
MAIDISALRKFQDLWGPVLEAIPAVMDAVARQSDIDREVQVQIKALEKAQQEVASVYEEANNRLTAVNAELDAIALQKCETLAAIADEQAKAKEATASALSAEKKKLQAVSLQVQQVTEKLEKVEAEYAAKLASCQADHATVLARMENEVKAMEDRQAKAELALEALKAKLG